MSDVEHKESTFREENPSPAVLGIDENDRQMVYKIKRITSKGNDAEVRRKRDGTLVVYEVRKNTI